MSARILIVDDAEGVQQSLSGILEDEGYRVAGAGSAGEARGVLAREAQDLVMLDLQLPDANGLELLSELQQEHDELPVIVISGHANIDSAVKATRLGAYDFLEKPLSLERVVLTVGNALEKRRMSRRLE
ncbi:MAG: sigma-54-dependent Fis family transcriptional regulator, partial [bacterium]|nr:sigma-54-dependent Fis family transcriptional regulator [bacterium]